MAETPDDSVQDAEDLARWMFWRAKSMPGGPHGTWAALPEIDRAQLRVISEEIVSGHWRRALEEVRAHG